MKLQRKGNTWPICSALVCAGLALVGCGGGGAGSSSSVSLTNGLIHEWKFDGDATDSVGTLNGTTVGAVTYAKGILGQGIVLDGNTMAVTLPAAADMQFQGSFSLSAWANIFSYPSPSKGASQIIFCGDDRGGLDPYYMSISPYGTLQFEVCGAAVPNEGLQVFGGDLPLNTFALISATYDQPSGTMRLYENGKLIGELLGHSDLTPVVPLDPSSNPGIGIGNNNAFPVSSYNYGWNGEIDDVRVYNRALSAAEVLALYNQGIAASR